MIYGVTWNALLLLRVPLGVITLTVPLVAPAGTVVVISVAETTVNVAAVPLKLTPVVPVRFVPRMMTAAPTSPDAGSVCTNGPMPTEGSNDILYTVPQPFGALHVRFPPKYVTP